MITKIFTPKNILIALLVLVVIYLTMCNKPKPIDIPSTVPVKEQEKTVAKIDKAKENSDDSIKALLKFKDDEINRYYNKLPFVDKAPVKSKSAISNFCISCPITVAN